MADDQYLIEIRSDISDLRRDMETVRRDVRRTSNQMSRDMEQSGRNIKQSFTRAAAGIAAAFAAIQSARALGDIAVQALGAAEAIQDVADAANVSAEFLQGLRGVTQQSGAEARNFDDAIVRLNRRLGLFSQYLATGEGEAGPAANALRALGLEADVVAGRLDNTETAFFATVEALQSVESQSRRAALASQLFGEDSGPRLVGLINRGTQGILELVEAMRAAGRIMSDDLTAGAAAASDELEALDEIVRARLNTAVAENRESVVALAEVMADLQIAAINTSGAVAQFFQTFRIGHVQLLEAERQAAETAEAIERIHTAAEAARSSMSMVFVSPEDIPVVDETPELRAAIEAREAREAEEERVRALLAEYDALKAPDGDKGEAGVVGGFADYVATGLEDKDDKAEELLEHVREMGEAMEEAKTAGDGLGDVLDNLGEHGEQAAKAFENAFVRAIETGRLEVEDLGRQILRIFAQIAYQETFEGPIRGLIRGVFNGGGGIGKKASGGPGSGLTLVGEQGPELVNLGDHANVMTANLTRMAMRNATASGGVNSNSVSQSFVIDARGADMGVEERLRQVLAEQAPLMQQRATVGALEAMNAIQKRQRAV